MDVTKRQVAEKLAVLGLSLAVVVYWQLWRVLVPGFYLNDDNANYFLGAYGHNFRSVVEMKEIPLVNFHQALGDVHLGQGQTGVLYAPIYLAFWLSKYLWGNLLGGIELLILIHWWLGVGGMYWWMRKKGVSWKLAVVGSWLWLSFPFVTGVSRSWIVVAYLFAYLPWGWGTLEEYLEAVWAKDKRIREKRWFLAAVGVRWALVLTGYVQWIAVSSLIEGIFVLVAGWKRGQTKEKILLSLRRTILVWLVSLALGAPVILPLARTMSRSVTRFGAVGQQEFVDRAVEVGWWVKAQVGGFEDRVYFDGSSYILHVGGLVLGVGFWLWWKRKLMGRGKGEFEVWIVMMLVVWLFTTKIYGWFYWVPGLNLFRWPFKYYLFFLFFVTVGLVVGMGKMGRKSGLSRFGWIMIILAGLINVGVMIGHRTAESAFSYHQVDPRVNYEWIGKTFGSDKRIFTLGATVEPGVDHMKLLTFNYASLFGLKHFGGHNALLARDLWEVLRGVPAFGTLRQELERPMVEYLRSWGVGYWVTGDLKAGGRLSQDYEGLRVIYADRGLVVYEDDQAWPLVYERDNREPVKYEFGVNRIKAWPRKTGEVVFNVFYWPEYKVWVDGKEAKVSNLNFRPAVWVEGGREVRLEFIDGNFNIGLGIAGMTLALLGGLGVMSLKKEG